MRHGVLALLLVVSAVSARAHDTWIKPRAFRVAIGAPLVVDMTSGMGFPALDHAPEAERLATAKVRLQGRVHDIEGKARGSHALVLTARPRAAGIAAVYVLSRPARRGGRLVRAARSGRRFRASACCSSATA